MTRDKQAPDEAPYGTDIDVEPFRDALREFASLVGASSDPGDLASELLEFPHLMCCWDDEFTIKAGKYTTVLQPSESLLVAIAALRADEVDGEIVQDLGHGSASRNCDGRV